MVAYIWHYVSPLGGITVASDGLAITGLWFDGQQYFGQGLDADCQEKALPIFDKTVRWLDIYFSGRDPGFTPQLSLQTTPFRNAVCQIMLRIPYGRTLTYGAIAKQIAAQRGVSQMSARAIGSAVSHNPISLIIPCHRVVGANGNLTGYAGGIDKKIQLLTLEKVDLAPFFVS